MLEQGTTTVRLVLRQRIGAGEAIARDLPVPVRRFPENEELLIPFRALRSRRVNYDCSGRIGTREDPVGSHLNNLGETELDAQLDGLEHRVVGLPHRCRANSRLALGRHKYAVVCIEPHDRGGIGSVQRVLILRQYLGNRFFVCINSVTPSQIGMLNRFT
jgi:hypothetical protein